MQLKRLRKTGAVASQPADDSKTTQDISESQLLRELEDLTGGFAANDNGDAAAPAATAAVATVAGSTVTPAAGTARRGRSSGLTSSGKRQRRELKSLFGSQDDDQQQQQQGGGFGLGSSEAQQGQVSQASGAAGCDKHGSHRISLQLGTVHKMLYCPE
jgi:hypothetical protein